MTAAIFTIREARQDDLEPVLEMLHDRHYADLPLRGLTGPQRRDAAIRGYRENWQHMDREKQLKILVAEDEGGLAGAVVFLTGMRESITYDQQVWIYDHFTAARSARSQVLHGLLDCAEAIARDEGDQYSTVELMPGEPDEELFGPRGYSVELNRIVKRVQSHDIRPSSSYRIREADKNDQMFIIYLNALVNKYTIPAGRDGDPELVAERYLDAYFSLDVGREAKGFLCEAGPERTAVGYLLLKTGYQELISGQTLGYIYDLAVHPDHWGRRATQLIMRTAENRLAQAGVPLYTGDISERNQRALKTSIKSLGFTVEWRRWGKRL
ncbi:MAG: GNAT family N-acetyltransferase [Armatimonadetes bacterium]|nr:GNAT family N-acetyltransferase [Armatimonadota bacterium]